MWGVGLPDRFCRDYAGDAPKRAMVDLLGLATSIGERALDALGRRRRLKVRTRLGFPPTLQAHRLLVMTEVTNVGHRRVVVNGCGFNVNRNRTGCYRLARRSRFRPPLKFDIDQAVSTNQ